MNEAKAQEMQMADTWDSFFEDMLNVGIQVRDAKIATLQSRLTAAESENAGLRTRVEELTSLLGETVRRHVLNEQMLYESLGLNTSEGRPVNERAERAEAALASHPTGFRQHIGVDRWPCTTPNHSQVQPRKGITMPMDFPDMESLTQAAHVHNFRKPQTDEPEASYRAALAAHVRPIDFIESEEIRNGKGWDKWSVDENKSMLARSILTLMYR